MVRSNQADTGGAIVAKKTLLAAFRETFQIQQRKPATTAELAKAEKKSGLTLPKSVHAWYLSGNGGKGRSQDLSSLELYTLSEAIKLGNATTFFESCWGLWPLMDNQESNPICVCCKSPLAGYVVLVNHDDQPKLLARSIESFLRTAIDYVSEGDYLEIHEFPTDFDGPYRTKGDLVASRALLQLLQTDDALTEDEQVDAGRFACDLLSDKEIAGIQALLEIDDEYIQEHVTTRLSRLQKLAARKAVQKSAETFDSFVIQCAKILKQAGIAATTVEMYGKPTVRLDLGPVWLNMEFYYAKRKQADFQEMFLKKVKAVAPKKKAGKK